MEGLIRTVKADGKAEDVYKRQTMEWYKPILMLLLR